MLSQASKQMHSFTRVAITEYHKLVFWGLNNKKYYFLTILKSENLRSKC